MREKGKDEGKVRGKGPTAEEGRAKGATGGADVAGADEGESQRSAVSDREEGADVRSSGRRAVGEKQASEAKAIVAAVSTGKKRGGANAGVTWVEKRRG